MAGGHYLLLAKFLHARELDRAENAADELIGAAPGMETARSNAAIFALAERAARLEAVRDLLLAEEPQRALARLAAIDRPLASYLAGRAALARRAPRPAAAPPDSSGWRVRVASLTFSSS